MRINISYLYEELCVYFYEYFLSRIIYYAIAIIRNSRNSEANRKRIDQSYKDFKIPIN